MGDGLGVEEEEYSEFRVRVLEGLKDDRARKLLEGLVFRHFFETNVRP